MMTMMQLKMVATELLSRSEIEWLDSYHARVRSAVGAYLQAQGKHAVVEWLHNNTITVAEHNDAYVQ